PDNGEVRDAIATRPLYKSAITKFLLLEYDRSLGGDAHDTIETIEHVLPQSPDDNWKETYGEEFIPGDVDALPNLVPCTDTMNSSLGNQSYEKKRTRFAQDSKFKSTRDF